MAVSTCTQHLHLNGRLSLLSKLQYTRIPHGSNYINYSYKCYCPTLWGSVDEAVISPHMLSITTDRRPLQNKMTATHRNIYSKAVNTEFTSFNCSCSPLILSSNILCSSWTSLILSFKSWFSNSNSLKKKKQQNKAINTLYSHEES